MSERSHRHISTAHSRSRPTRTKRGWSLSNSSAISNCEPHEFHSPPYLGGGGSRIVGSRRLPLFPQKEGQTRAGLFHRNKLTVHADFPSRTSCACSLPKQRRKDCVCVIGCQITRTRIHTLLKCLASARHDNRELYSYQNARFKQTSQ